MLAKICGWNEPERVQSQQVSIQVDAKLLEELRKGATQLAQGNKHALLCGANLASKGLAYIPR
jgi:hypothetical protein